MVRRPSSSSFALSIDDDFDDAQNYRVRLYELEERESQFADSKGRMAIVWKFNLYRADGTAFEDPRYGTPFELWAWTSDSTFRTSKGRSYIDALLGGEQTDEQIDLLIDSGFEEGLVGKTALGSFETYSTEDGNERLRLLLLRPDKAAKPPTARRQPPESESEPEPEPVPAAAPRARRRIDD
jgi:hypothetical protein